MNPDSAAACLFNPRPTITTVPLPGRAPVVVVDDVLLDPDAVVTWATGQVFQPPRAFPYPGVVRPAPADLSAGFGDFFAVHVREFLGVDSVLAHDLRLSMVTTPPARLDPRQWQCHRDAPEPGPTSAYVASVLYLFRDPSLGGTSFYRPLRPDAEINRLLDDSLQLGREAFRQRHDVQPGYMDGSNAYFERIGQAAAAWNRMIFYDGGMFHSGDVGGPQALDPDPRRGRLTINGFFTCTTAAR